MGDCQKLYYFRQRDFEKPKKSKNHEISFKIKGHPREYENIKLRN